MAPASDEERQTQIQAAVKATSDSLKATHAQEAKADCLKKAEAQKAQQKAQDDWNNFTTPDLAFFELKGHVKEVVYTKANDRMTLESTTYTFDKNGRMIDGNGYSRGSNGRICRQGEYSEVVSRYVYTEYVCDSKGRVVKASCDDPHDGYAFNETYLYNSSGLLIKKTGSDDCGGDYTSTFSYQKYDNVGNWTCRTYKDVFVDYEDLDETYTERRIITYYPAP